MSGATTVREPATPREPSPAGPWWDRGHRALRITGDVLAVLGCWVVGLVLVGFGLEDTPEQRSDAVVVLDVLLGLVLTPLLFARRRWPVAVAVVVTVASTLSWTLGLVSLVTLFGVAVRRRLAVAAWVAGAVVVSAVVQGVVWPEPDIPWWAVVPVFVAVVVGTLAWGTYVRARRQLAASWREQAERSRAEQELRADRARSVERARIAREMHDVLAHRISLVSMHAGALELRLEGSADPEVVASAGTIRRSAHAALQDLRDILGVLREESSQEAATPQPTLGDLPALVEEVRALGLPVDLDVSVADVSDVPEALGRTAFRVVQEGLTNVRKHAPGHRARVRVSGRRGRALHVVVQDRPGGGSAVEVGAPSSGFGLVGLRERVELVGGTVRAHREGEGFALVARLPWPRRA
ncbi:sensor histidine kinase [Kineococcus sp. SYSU DK001]|uniref:sensor histidine kinase n=1 Tax=Kineococcus sp. SYSU DK001 TaxID=3383122 RepID=UPI003D7DCA9E